MAVELCYWNVYVRKRERPSQRKGKKGGRPGKR
jgi:hypothetical protein